MKKRMFALVLTICMVLSLLPVQAFATEADTPAELPQQTAEVPQEPAAEESQAPAQPAGEETPSQPAGNKITFNGNGGQVRGVTAKSWTSADTYAAGETVSIAAALGSVTFTHDLSDDYSTNYRLLGWNTQADGKGTQYGSQDSLVMPDSALTLYAQWEGYEWIHWNIQMGEGGDHIEYTLGASGTTSTSCTSFKAYCQNLGNGYGMVPAAYYSPVKAFAKDGYVFAGWYYGDTLITGGNLTIDVFRSLPQLTMETSGAVLQARFEKGFKITYTDGFDGKAFADQVYFAEAGQPTPAFQGTPARDGFNFLGWNPELGETVTDNVTYVAQWDVKEPADPKYNTPKELFTIHCTSDDTHADAVWHWFGTHVVYNKDKEYDAQRGAWTATLTVKMIQFLTQYQKTSGHKHYCTDADGKKIFQVTIPVVWSPEENLWLPDGMTTINIWCYTAPAAPVASKISTKALRVEETGNAKSYISYPVKTLLADTYAIGEVTKDENGTFWSTLTITDLDAYAAAFNTKYNADDSKAPYRVDTETTTATFTFKLKYTGNTTEYKQDGSGWTVQYDNNTEKNNGKKLYVKSFYTVTYTDGVEDEEVFADQTYKAQKGDATPGFAGTPTRENWNFLGWNPEISETVTGDVTYVAQWEKATNKKPADNKKITSKDVDKMQIRALFAGTESLNPGNNEPLSCTPSIYAKGVSYTIGDVVGNDVDGYTTTITFQFEGGDEFEAAARKVFNENKAYEKYRPDWSGEWVYTFTKEHPDVQTLTLHWVGTYSTRYNKWNYAWKLIDKYGNYNSNITSAVATLIQVELALNRTVTYTDGVENQELFADQTYTVRNGSATPAFVGTPAREGYTFVGWNPELAEKVYADVTYVAQWTVNQYTLTFDTAGGSEITPMTVDYGATITPPEDPTREGYVFTGWEPAIPETMPAKNVTVTAQWIKCVERLDFSLGGHGYKKPFIDTTVTPGTGNEGVTYGDDYAGYGDYYGIVTDENSLEALSSGVFREEKDYFLYVTFFEADGYTLSTLKAENIFLDGTPALNVICKDKEMTAVFDLRTIYLIKASSGRNGEIDPEGVVPVLEGENVTFTITPDDGYVRSTVKVDGKKVKVSKTYTFKNVQDSHTIHATFAKTSNPKTGDDSGMQWAFHALTISAGALAALLILRKKKRAA